MLAPESVRGIITGTGHPENPAVKSDDSDIINAGDSMWINIEIFRFPDWQNANITVNTDVHDIANMLRVEYCKDVKDRNPQFNQYDLEFEQNHPNVNYFEIPRGSNIYPM